MICKSCIYVVYLHKVKTFSRLLAGLLPLLIFLSTALSITPLFVNSASAASTYEYVEVSSSSNPGSCDLGSSDKSIAIIEKEQSSGANSTLTYYWCLVPQTSYEFTRQGNQTSRIVVDESNAGQGNLRTSSSGQSNTISISNSGVVAQNTGNTDSGSDDSSCESIGVMGWLVCPLINFMSGAINWLDERIQKLLAVGEDKYTNPELKVAWSNFRNIAYIILIPIMLVMVISTALGFDIFNAYTVKKALPRMVIAVIFITMSWYITVFLISFFNTIGSGILGLMTSPFGIDNGMNLNSLFGASSDNVGDVASTAGSAAVQWAAVLGPLVGLAALATSPGGLAILFLYLGPALLFILGAFLVLVLREMFILAGVLLAPLAILAWIFPGNDSMWKLWWNTFSKLLLMYPLIMLILGAGRIFAHLLDISGAGSFEALLIPLLKLTAYILPYMFIPFAFKFAGGVFANLAGMVNDRERGLFDRMKKSRQEKWGSYRSRGGKNEVYGKERAEGASGFKGRWMRGVNSASGWVFDPVNSTKIKLGTEGGKKVLSQIGLSHNEANLKLAEKLGKSGANDKLLRALYADTAYEYVDANGVSHAAQITKWDGTMSGLGTVARDLQLAGQRTGDATYLLAAKTAGDGGLNWLANKNMDEETIGASVNAAAVLAQAQQGFVRRGEIQSVASGMSIGSEASGFVTTAQLMGARSAGMKPGYGVRAQVNAEGKVEYVAGDLGAMIEQATRMSTQDFGGMKGGEFERNFGEAIKTILSSPQDNEGNITYIDRSGDQPVQKTIKLAPGTQQTVRETIVQTYASYTTPDTRNRIKKMLIESKEMAAPGPLTDAQRRQIAEEVDRELRRFSDPNTENNNNRPDPNPPAGGPPGGP